MNESWKEPSELNLYRMYLPGRVRAPCLGV